MEYNVLTTTNVILRIIEVLAHTMFVTIILNKKVSIKRFLLFSIILSGIFETTRTVLPQYVSGIITALVFIPALKLLLKEKWRPIVCSYIVTAITVGIVDCIVSFTIIAMFDIDTFSEAVNNQFIYIVASLAISLIMFIISGYIHYSRLVKNSVKEIKNVKNFGVLINYIVMFTILVPNLVTLIYYHDKRTLPFEFIFINICSIIILFFINMYNTNNNIKLAKTEQDLIAQQKYSKTQQDLIDGLRTFKHDYSNTLQTMRGYVEYNKIDKLKEMFEQVLDETKAITTLDKLNPNTIKDPGLFGILSGKYQKAKEANIKMEVEIFGDIEEIDIEIFDLTRMLGILLDNAIEAAKNSKKRRITFMLTERRNEVSFEITNSFSGKKINLEKIKEKGVSSKGKNRGLGLYKVEEIVSKYASVQNITQVEKDIFIQILTIAKVENMINC